jgi:sugar phosphate isomerase/epimerase
MARLGIEFISVFGMPPLQFVDLAADLGCETISLGLAPLDANPHGYPAYALSDLRQALLAALRERGVALALAEGFFVLPGRDVSAYAADLDLMCELGAERINTLCLDSDRTRGFDQLGVLVEMAAARGLGATLEFIPASPVGDLATAADAVRHVGRPEFGILVDTMHLVRSGGSAADLTALDPALIHYAQLCDVPLRRTDLSYGEEAKYERRAPGDGELPLLDILAALPRDRVVGLEIPQRSLAEAGVGPHERLGRCVDAARALLEQLDA